MIKKLIYITFLVLFATSCSNTKHLPEGELLYVGGKVKVVKEDSVPHKDRKKLHHECLLFRSDNPDWLIEYLHQERRASLVLRHVS